MKKIIKKRNPQFVANYAVFSGRQETFMSLKPILCDKELSFQAKIMFQLISSLSVIEGYCYASNLWLSIKLGVSISTIKRIIRELEKSGLINSVMVPMPMGQCRRMYINFKLLRLRYLKGKSDNNIID